MEHRPTVLIVDDDNRILELLKQFFNKNGFNSLTAINSEKAFEIINKNEVDLFILDVMLPGVTGLEFAKQIKEKSKKAPIILLTALTDPEDRVRGLESGADDYITKPFEPRELILRAKNLLELYKKNINPDELNNNNIISFGNFTYYLDFKKLYNEDEEIILTSTENKLLEYLLLNRGRAVSRDELSRLMGGLSDRSIDVQIVRLRQKIEENAASPKYLITVRHEGYGFFI